MGAGILAALGGAGGGADPAGAQPAGAGQDPAAILSQIRALLDQYLALGPDTPVAHEAMALADAIDSTSGQADGSQPAGTEAGAATAGVEGTPAEEAAETPDEEKAEVASGAGDDLGGSYSGSDMGEARSGAKAFLRKKNKTAKAS